jgi:hypothetical protein
MDRQELARAVTRELERRGARRAGAELKFTCPEAQQHRAGDRHPSANWNEAKGVWLCRVCGTRGGTQDLAARLGVAQEAWGTSREVARWTIRALDGAPLAVHVRMELPNGSKQYPWFHADGRTPGCPPPWRPATLPLYGAHLLAGQSPDGLLVVAEGEKATDALIRHGLDAVGVVTGASKGTPIPCDATLTVLKGRRVILWPDADDVGRDLMRQIGVRLTALGILWAVFDPWGDDSKRDAADWTEPADLAPRLAAVAPTPPPPPWLRMHLVQRRPIDWLWRSRIPFGFLTLLEGHPGLGKSVLTIDLAARASRGAPMPNESVGIAPLQVLLLSAEDSPDQVMLDRLIAAGADLTKVAAFPLDDVLGFPADVGRLEEAITSLAARLVVVDPLAAFLAVNMNRDQEVRQALTPLTAVANRTNCALVAIRHLTKASGVLAIHRGGGSIGISGAARSELLIGRDPADADMRVLASVKNNLGPQNPPSLCYSTSAHADEPVVVVWHGTSEHTADSLTRAEHEAATVPGLRDKLTEAIGWLRELLRDGPRSRDEIARQGKTHNYRQVVLDGARRALGVQVRREFSGTLVWELPPMH